MSCLYYSTDVDIGETSIGYYLARGIDYSHPSTTRTIALAASALIPRPWSLNARKTICAEDMSRLTAPLQDCPAPTIALFACSIECLRTLVLGLGHNDEGKQIQTFPLKKRLSHYNTLGILYTQIHKQQHTPLNIILERWFRWAPQQCTLLSILCMYLWCWEFVCIFYRICFSIFNVWEGFFLFGHFKI